MFPDLVSVHSGAMLAINELGFVDLQYGISNIMSFILLNKGEPSQFF